MNAATIVRFLFGQRQAILQVADTRNAVWLGGLFVLSAGFAREYDGEDLLHEPWHLLIPFAASIATSYLLFVLLRMIVRWHEKQDRPSHFASYRSFLALYWMTAPLAWLYAIPFERFQTAAEATSSNLTLLGIVAVWRVVLMTRIVAVVFEVPHRCALFPVMLFADTVAVVVSFVMPTPVISFMGGIRLTESEQLIQSMTWLVRFFGILTWLIWMGGTATVGFGKRTWSSKLGQFSSSTTVGRSAWILAAIAIVFWIPLLPVPQREQQLRRAVENDLRDGRIREALQTMSDHSQSDFPPHWDPPPRIGYGENVPSLTDVLQVAQSIKIKRWVLALFELKLIQQSGWRYAGAHKWARMDDDEFDRNFTILEKLPADSPVLNEHREIFQTLLSDGSLRTKQQKERIRKLFGFEDPAEKEAGQD